MVKFKDTSSFEVSDYNNKDELPDDAWRVRPCEWYKDEYKECTNIKSRFHQYFIHGETLDCSQWKIDYDNCKLFRNKNDLKALENVIQSEKERYHQRKISASGNNVWVYRNLPPENWNSPMPEWMLEKKKNSLLGDTQDMLDKGTTPSPVFSGFSCTIM